MSRELIGYHLQANAEFKNCATTSLAAIVPVPLEKATIHGLFNNTTSLDEIMVMASLEFHRLGIKLYLLYLPDGHKPSEFFVRVAHILRHGPPLARFYGGLMLTKKLSEYDHVIAVTNIHEQDHGKKATIVNTYRKRPDSPYVLKVPVEWLDRNIHPDDGVFAPRAVALLGKPINESDCKEKKLYAEELKFRQALLGRSRLIQQYNHEDEKQQWQLNDYTSKKQFRQAIRMKSTA